MFIEPAVRFQDESGICYPDLLICNSLEVIGVVELKYTPRASRSPIRKDIRALCRLANYEGELAVSNQRFRGPQAKIRPYRFSSHVVFVWAGIHAEPELDACKRFKEEVAANPHRGVGKHSLLQLHAVTLKDSEPKISHYRS
jgi:hypothetical protein